MANRHDVVEHPFTLHLVQIKAAQLCRRSDFSRSDHDDLKQEMLLYLWEKSHLFDPARGALEAFVTTALKSWVGMELRRRARHKRVGDRDAASLEGTEIECDGDTVQLDSVIEMADLQRRTGRCRPNAFEMLDQHDAVGHAFAPLSLADQRLLFHVTEYGVAGTARRHQVSRRQIGNALTRMRSRFEEAGLAPR